MAPHKFPRRQSSHKFNPYCLQMFKRRPNDSLRMIYSEAGYPKSLGTRVARMLLRRDRSKQDHDSSSSQHPSKELQNSNFAGGVYYEIGDASQEKPSSRQSLDTTNTHSSTESWQSSGSSDHHEGAPRIARNFSRRRINPANADLADTQLMGHIIMRSRQMPRNYYFASNHVMINNERAKLIIAPLKRLVCLDELARTQAKVMAEKECLFHSNPEELIRKIAADQEDKNGCESPCPSIRIGKNIGSGVNLNDIHKTMMTKSLADKNNILDRRYAYMGVGTAKGSDGSLYLCQIFQE